MEAQAEIKSTVTVNTSDIAAKAQEDGGGGGGMTGVNGGLSPIERLAAMKGGGHGFGKGRKGGGGGRHANGNIIMTEELKEELDEATLATQQAYTAVRIKHM